MIRYVMLGVGGALGAIARYQVSTWVQARVTSGFPWGTFWVNISGCFLLGIVTTAASERFVAQPELKYLIPIGFIGAYTTFSTFELELLRAGTDGAWLIGGAYLVSSVLAGYLALWVGLSLARML